MAQKTTNNTAFDVLQSEDRIHRRYSLTVPYQVTYEFVSGSSPEDYLNALTLSENGQYLWSEPASSHNEKFRSTAPHSHDYYEWMIVLEGAVSQYMEGNLYRYEAGTACLVNRNVRHKEQFHERARILFIGLSEAYLVSLLEQVRSRGFREEVHLLDAPLFHLIHEDLENPERNVYLDLIPTMQHTLRNLSDANGHYKLFHDISEQLLHTLLHPSFGSAALADGLIASLLGILADPANYHCTKVELTRDRDFLLFQHAEHMLSESGGRLSRSELAASLSYSSDYIGRVIKKYSGFPFQEYRLQFLLRQAAFELIHTRKTIEDISRDLGFSNRTYFYRVFQAKYGVTPRRYRLNMHAAVLDSIHNE